MLNRRQAFRSLGLGATAAIIPASAILAASGSPELDRLIQAHRTVDAEWVVAYESLIAAQKLPTNDGSASTIERELCKREAQALDALVSYRPSNLLEVQKRFDYLIGTCGPWDGLVPDEAQMLALFESMATRAA